MYCGDLAWFCDLQVRGDFQMFSESGLNLVENRKV